jgi:hypothetical protein
MTFLSILIEYNTILKYTTIIILEALLVSYVN